MASFLNLGQKLKILTMKKLIPLFTFIIISTQLSAQTFYAQGGVNFANISTNTNGSTEKNNTLTSFNAGFMGRFGLSKLVDLESGLILMGQGAKAETYFNTPDNGYVKSKFNPLYVQLPLNLLLQAPLGSRTKIFFNAGPYIAIGVGGKSKVESSTILGVTNSESNIKFSNDDPFTSQQDDAAYDKLKRFDFGLNGGVGFDFSTFIIKANYGLGLAKINSTQSNNSVDDKNKYRTISVSVGIPLNK